MDDSPSTNWLDVAAFLYASDRADTLLGTATTTIDLARLAFMQIVWRVQIWLDPSLELKPYSRKMRLTPLPKELRERRRLFVELRNYELPKDRPADD